MNHIALQVLWPSVGSWYLFPFLHIPSRLLKNWFYGTVSLLCKNFAPARLRNRDHRSNRDNVTNSGNGAQQFRRRCPSSCNVKIKCQPSFYGRHVSQQKAVFRNPYNSSHILTTLPDRWVETTASVKKVYCPCSFLSQCFSTFVRPRPGKFFFHKTRARSQQIIRKYLSIFLSSYIKLT